MMRRLLPSLCLLSLVLVTVAGCWGDDPGDPAPEPVPPVSRAALLPGFVAAHENMDADAYAALVDTGFRFYLTERTQAEFGLEADHLGHDEDLALMRRLFSGEAWVQADGSVAPGVTSVIVNYLTRETDWQDVADDERFPDGARATFTVHADFERGASHPPVAVRGLVEIFVVNHPREYRGAMTDDWRLAGQVDYTGGYGQKRPTEEFAWGDVKLLYR